VDVPRVPAKGGRIVREALFARGELLLLQMKVFLMDACRHPLALVPGSAPPVIRVKGERGRREREEGGERERGEWGDDYPGMSSLVLRCATLKTCG
jgi:hypothetical protein